MKEATPAWPTPPSPFARSDWFDPLEEAVRGQVRSFIEQLLEEELEAALGRERYQRGAISNMQARVSRKLLDRIERLPQAIRDIAWRAQRYRRLAAAGKP